jgi:hypothetical protein
MKRAIIRFVCVTIFLLTWVAYAQNTVRSASKSQAPEKITMTECEGGDNCATWTFLWASGKGYGKWRNGEEAVLEIEALASGKIVVHRSDVTGAKEGLTATYDGTLTDHQLGGNFDYAYKGKTGSGYWNAIVGPAPPTPPAVMRVCAAVCATWTWNNGHYEGLWENGLTGTMTIVSFTQESVNIDAQMHDSTNQLRSYKGTISADGNSILGGKQTFVGTGYVIPFMATWGAVLNTARVQNEQQTPTQLGNDAVTRFARDVAANVAKDLLKDWIENLIRNNQ